MQQHNYRPLGPDEPPTCAALWRDARGMLVGAQGYIRVQAPQRLTALLAALAQRFDLSRGVAVEALEDGTILVRIQPAAAADVPLSLHYDAVQSALGAAHLSTLARLFVGDGEIGVPYADAHAPHGYDLEGSGAPWPAGTPLALREYVLGATPALLPPATHSLTLTLLTERRLASLIADYAQRHGLAYAVRFLHWEVAGARREAALFDLVHAAEVRPIPGFVCDFLRRLPRTTLLEDLLGSVDLDQEPARRMLVPWGYRPQAYPPHIQHLFPDQSIVVLGGSAWGAAVLTAPPPRSRMQDLTLVALPDLAQVAASSPPAAPLQIQIELVPTERTTGSIHALLLDAPALARLQRIVRHLPAPFFATARIALGEGVALIIAADHGEVTGLPLGLALTRSEPPHLFLPRGISIRPSLPQDLLVEALNLQPDTLTVLGPHGRLDVPLAAFKPLTSLLALAIPTQKIALRPTALPTLDLRELAPTPTKPPAAPVAPVASPSEPEQRGIFQRLIGGKPAPGGSGVPFDQELRQRATALEQRGDYELAAAFYTYLGDSKRAAACYRRIAEMR
ncbi:hypothetical protein [Candidatus Oscillochloris fontis]|uniref:hypothetical protein n=1 Tax=Candidatus Oscillochloris fontis TaxID=2496868 RepID=UPI00101B8408|nr:hypothetical protein [Candidatus Oscillochloris fontis]